jgi:carboxylesterase type B
MAAPLVQHQGLEALFTGVRRDFDGVIVDQFRGIKYAKIPARFERAQPVESFGGGVVDATKYGYVLCLSPRKRSHTLWAYNSLY